MIRSSLRVASLVVLFPLIALGQHNHAAHSASTDQPEKPLEPKEGVQKLCPVSGKPVKDDVSVELNGRIIKFCCTDCIAAYRKDPGKYAPALYKQIYPQHVQIRCPVMGGDVDPKVFVEHKGEKVYFCCKGCDGTFQKDPAKYEANLKKAYTEQVHCPVMGGVIDPAVSTESKQGTVYFCCPSCVDKYKANPANYEAAVRPAVGLLAHGETLKDDLVRCPVCPPDKVHRRGEVKSVVHAGKTYFLCNDKCAKAFEANPDKYTKKLEQVQKPKQ